MYLLFSFRSQDNSEADTYIYRLREETTPIKGLEGKQGMLYLARFLYIHVSLLYLI